MKRLIILVISLLAAASANAQEKPVDIGLETRASYSAGGPFSIDYCAFYAKGGIGKDFSYYFYGYPNKITSLPFFYEALSWGMLSYSPSKNWNFEIGKQMIEYAGIEYYYKPIDVFTPSEYWRNYAAFQMGFTSQYITDSGDTFSLQVGESPFSGHRAGNTLYNYSTSVRGDHDHAGYSASLNFLEYSRGSYASHQVVSGWACLGPVKLELDVINRCDAEHFQLFKDFSVVSEAVINLGSDVQLFLRYSKDKNVSGGYYDELVYNGEDVSLMSGGLLWRPVSGDGSVRLHLYYSSVSGKESPIYSSLEVGASTLNFGATWDIKFIKR